MKVLLVEDDATTAELVQRGLTARGVDVCAVVATIEAAVAMARRHHPDLAVIDIHLEHGDLGTAIPSLLPKGTPMGVLFASGTDSAEQVSGAGGIALIEKPFGISKLLLALAIVREIATTGASARLVPDGVYVLNNHAAVAL